MVDIPSELRRIAYLLKRAHVYDRYNDVLDAMVSEFRHGGSKHQPWTLVPKGRLVKIWRDYAKMGVVRDSKGIDEILERMKENALRIAINTELAGHEQTDPKDMVEEYDMDEDELQRFIDWAVDLPTGGWRISDYGLDKIFRALNEADDAASDEQRLVAIDKALNVTHQRSDFASWFIEGGSATLNLLANS